MNAGFQISVYIPGVPIGKGRARTRVMKSKSGKSFATHYTLAATRDWEADAAVLAKEAMRGQAPLEGPITLHITAWMPVPASWSKNKRD